MSTLQDLDAAVENTEQPTIAIVQGGNNENERPILSLVQETLDDDDEGATSLQCDEDVDNFEANVPRSPSPPSPPTNSPVVPRMITPHDPNTKSVDVDQFLKTLKKKPASSSSEKCVTTRASLRKEKEDNIIFFGSYGSHKI
jgi:hypothetical protein